MNADGSNQVPMTHLEPTGIFNRHQMPAWSPDAAKIAFRQPREDGGGIYVINADGTNETRLSVGGAWPAWSPDGAKIAFLSGRDNPQIYVMNADGTGVTPVTDRSNLAAHSAPAWAPGSVPRGLVAASTPTPTTPAPTRTAPAQGLEPVGTALTEALESPPGGGIRPRQLRLRGKPEYQLRTPRGVQDRHSHRGYLRPSQPCAVGTDPASQSREVQRPFPRRCRRHTDPQHRFPGGYSHSPPGSPRQLQRG